MCRVKSSLVSTLGLRLLVRLCPFEVTIKITASYWYGWDALHSALSLCFIVVLCNALSVGTSFLIIGYGVFSSGWPHTPFMGSLWGSR